MSKLIKEEKKASILMIVVFVLTASIILLILSFQGPQIDDPALVVNGEEISLDEVRNTYVTYEQPVSLDTVVEDIIDYELIIQDSNDITVTDEEVETALTNALSRQQITREQFEQANTTSIENFKQQLRTDLLVNKALSSLTDNVSQAQAQQYYQNNIDQFLVPQQVIAQQLTLPGNLTQTQLQLQVNEIYTALQNQEFCTVVEQYSTNPECESYSITNETTFPEYVNAAFNQEVGAVSLVQGPDGFYFVRTIDKQNFNPAPFEQVEQNIRQLLLQQQFQREYDNYVSALREDADIVNNIN